MAGPQLPAFGRELAAAGASAFFDPEQRTEAFGAQRPNRSDRSKFNEGEADLRAEPAATGAFEVSMGLRW